MTDEKANVTVDDPLSFAEVEKLHAETQMLDVKGISLSTSHRLPVKTTPSETKRSVATRATALPPVVSAPVMDAREIDEMMKTLNDIENDTPVPDEECDWAPAWSTTENENEQAESSNDQLSAIKNLLKDIETSVGNLDEGITDTRARVEEAHREIERARTDIAGINRDMNTIFHNMMVKFEQFTAICSAPQRSQTGVPVDKQ